MPSRCRVALGALHAPSLQGSSGMGRKGELLPWEVPCALWLVPHPCANRSWHLQKQCRASLGCCEHGRKANFLMGSIWGWGGERGC